MFNIIREHILYLIFAYRNNSVVVFFKLLISPLSKDFRRDKECELLNEQLQVLITQKEFQKRNQLIVNSPILSKITSLNIFLAGEKHNLESEPIWNINYPDEEINLSLHRFGWLLVKVASKKISEDQAISYISHWINNNKSINEQGWDSYSVSERLNNWNLICGEYISRLKPDDPIRISIKLQAELLLSKIEIRGTSTNNHIFNNGKSLYISGLILDDSKLIEAGKKILSFSIKRNFYKSGMNKEGSSHYQIILTRGFIEILWFSLNFSQEVNFFKYKDIAKKCLLASKFFFEIKPFPFIGDISPDFRLDFFKDLIEVGILVVERDFKSLKNLNSESWSYFLTRPKKKYPINFHHKVKRSSEIYNEPSKYQDAGYYKFTTGDFCVSIFLNPGRAVMPGTHAHSDILSFILNYKGENILFDSGRSSYTNDKFSRYGKSIKAHNSISIDGRELQIVHGLNGYPELMEEIFLGNPAKIEYQEDPLMIKLSYLKTRFSKEKIFLERQLIFSKETLVVTDNIKGLFKHKIETRFHLNTDIISTKDTIVEAKFKNSSLQVDIDCIDYNINQIQGLKKNRSNYFSIKTDNYGEFQESNSIFIRQDRELPINNRFTFNFF